MSEEGLLALKIQVQGAFADLGALGDIVHRGTGEAFFQEDLSGGLEDGLTAFLFLPLAPGSGGQRGNPPN